MFLRYLIHDTANDTSYTPSASCSIFGINDELSGRANVAPRASEVEQEVAWLEKQRVLNEPEQLSRLVADGVVLGLMPNDDGELTSSSELTIVDFDSRVEDAAESRDKQQQLQRWGDLTPCLKEAGRVESSGTTTSRDGGKEDDVVSAGGFGKESEASNNDKRDRYEVERIFDHDEHNGRKRYLVKWSGWSAEDMTWEPEGNLDDCQYIVEQYWKSVENLDTTGNISGTSAHSLVRDDRSHLMHPLVKVFDRLDEVLTSLRDLLATQITQREAPQRSAPRLTTRKRKVSQDEQDFSTADEENKRTRKRPKKHCRSCRETGHNSRTCPT